MARRILERSTVMSPCIGDGKKPSQRTMVSFLGYSHEEIVALGDLTPTLKGPESAGKTDDDEYRIVGVDMSTKKRVLMTPGVMR